ncbi:MAG: PIN domain-containing protein [Chloroflexi bacterium]|nr:PIN domain-containing protein [Chloroflexota bacterium]
MIRAERVLIDSSVWLEVLLPRQGDAPLSRRVSRLVAEDLAATMPLIKLELLRGTRTREEWQSLGRFLASLRQLPLHDATWEEAFDLGFQLRRAGVTVPTPDIVIAALALSEDVVLLHRDRHFDQMAAHVPLKVESAL